MPANTGDEYLFFLEGYGDVERYRGMYYPIDLEFGKYVVPDDDIEAFAMNSNKTKIQSAKKRDISELYEIQTKNDYTKYLEWYDTLTKEFL